MFVASLADALPDLGKEVLETMKGFSQTSKGRLQYLGHHDGVLKGLRFDAAEHPHQHDHDHHHHHDHHHGDHHEHVAFNLLESGKSLREWCPTLLIPLF
ncbi:MAG: hypothetical protein ACOYKP_05150 [Polynucleobacter sp.]